MVNLRHAKKAQALASDLDYRNRLHEYTVVPEDMKTKWAKKAYGLQSDVSWYALCLCITKLFFRIWHSYFTWTLLDLRYDVLKCLQNVFWNWQVCTCSHANIVPVSPMLINVLFPQQLQYRSDLMWMKGVGCITEGSLNIQHAKNVGDLVSEVSRMLSLVSVVCLEAYVCLFHCIMWNR